ncbi:hypothetical protein AB0J83_03450 [Actinoplanes sp. NPDC049596]|uniref:hypothetical protein n=1 Tax=unclassified Actinoplanes TaxID=2626549 RepID=UPI00341D9D78
MRSYITTHDNGTTINQNLKAGTAHIELDTAATRTLRRFLDDTIISGAVSPSLVAAGTPSPQSPATTPKRSLV